MIFFKLLIVLCPWRIKRFLLNKFFDFELSESAFIGFSWVFPKKLIMNDFARIGHFNVFVHLDLVRMGSSSIIERKNWITGFSSFSDSSHFQHQKDRLPVLIIGKESAITKNHHLDCTNSILIGEFVTIAGYQSQLLTHSIDLFESRQDSCPIEIGDYSFVGTNVVILGGAKLPAYSILGAKSLLNKKFDVEWNLYAGNPARLIKPISKDAKYFKREEGFVW